MRRETFPLLSPLPSRENPAVLREIANADVVFRTELHQLRRERLEPEADNVLDGMNWRLKHLFVVYLHNKGLAFFTDIRVV